MGSPAILHDVVLMGSPASISVFSALSHIAVFGGTHCSSAFRETIAGHPEFELRTSEIARLKRVHKVEPWLCLSFVVS